MLCNGCGNDKAYRTFQGDGFEICDKCGDAPTVFCPDVYFDGKPEHGLADDPNTGKPRVFNSKGEKARYLREHNLVEGWHKTEQKQESARVSAERALAEVRKMGAEFKRQEFLRIKKHFEMA